MMIARSARYVEEELALKHDIMEGLPGAIGKETAEAFRDYVRSKKPATVGGFDIIDFRNNEAARQKVLSRACYGAGFTS